MIKGSYNIIKNGEVVASQDNIITTSGKDAILRFLGSSTTDWSENIAIGCGTTAATVNDYSLEYEVSRNRIKLRSPNISTSTATCSGTSAAYTVTATLPTTNTSGLAYTLVTTGLVATLSTGVATVTLTSGSTANMYVGQILTKTSGTGAFGANATVLSIQSSTAFTASINHATAGSTTFAVGYATIGTVTSQTATVTGLTTTSGLIVGGMVTSTTQASGVTGTGCVITSILGPNSITISAVSGMTAGSVTAFGSSYIVAGMSASGTNISSSSIVTAVDLSTRVLTLSHANTGTVSSAATTFTLRKIILKTELDTTLVTNIKEIGVASGNFSNSDGMYSKDLITRFDEGVSLTNALSWYSATTLPTNYTTLSDVGVSSLQLTTNAYAVLGSSNATPTAPGVLNDIISNYDRTDKIKLSVYNPTGSTITTAISVIFYDTQNTVQTLTWSVGSQGYTAGSTTILSASLSSLVDSGSFNYTISAIKITGAANLVFHSLKIDQTSRVNSGDSILSRTVLTTPVSKAAGDSLEVQYELILGL